MVVRIVSGGMSKTAAAILSEPINHRDWKEVVDDFDSTLEFAAHSEEDEAVVDLWLEDPHSFMGETDTSAHTGSMVRRMQTGGQGLQRSGEMAKTASASNWDQEFANAQSHAASVLKNLGNGR